MKIETYNDSYIFSVIVISDFIEVVSSMMKSGSIDTDTFVKPTIQGFTNLLEQGISVIDYENDIQVSFCKNDSGTGYVVYVGEVSDFEPAHNNPLLDNSGNYKCDELTFDEPELLTEYLVKTFVLNIIEG